MPLSYEIRDGVLRFETIGDVEFEAGLATLSDGIGAYHGEHAGHPRVVFDIRRSTEDRDSQEIRAIAERLNRELGGGRLAVVVAQPLYFGLSRMFASYLEPSGFEARVFEDADEALAFLLDPSRGLP